MKKLIRILTVIMILIPQTAAYANDSSTDINNLSEAVEFHNVIGIESIDDIKYATIEYYAYPNNICADIDLADIKTFLSVYWNFLYEPVIGPYYEDIIKDKYFINIWTDEKYVNDSKHTIYITDIIYGAYGNIKNEVTGLKYAYNYVWYKPLIGNSQNALISSAESLKEKYITKTRELNEYDSINVLKAEPNYLSISGCSPWAENIIQESAAYNLMPYVLMKNYTGNISREEFCTLAVQMIAVLYDHNVDSRHIDSILNQIIEKDYLKDIFDKVSYSDMSNISDEIKFLTAEGIITGNGNAFNPNSNITREEAAVILNRTAQYFNLETPDINHTFSDDKNISEWAKNGVYNMQSMGVMHGMDNNEFYPNENFTVEQSITTFLRLYKIISL